MAKFDELKFENIDLSRNRIEVNIEAIDPNVTNRSGLRYYLDIYVPDGFLNTSFKKLNTLEASEVPPYSDAGVTIFEGAYLAIERYLDSFLSYHLPRFGQKELSVADELTLPYRIVKRTVNGNSVTEVSLPTRYVIKAGIEEHDFPAWGSVLFTDKMDGLAGKFLTWQRGNRNIRLGQQVFLYFLINHTETPEALNVHLKYNDTTTIVYANILVSGGFLVYCIPVSIEALGLDVIPEVVRSYEVWVADEEMERISEIVKFVVDGSVLRNEKYILYSNGLGGFDSLLCKGESSENLNVVREVSERYLPFLSDASYSEKIINEVTGERELKVSFGLISNEQLDRLREVMYAKEIFLQGERNFIPLILKEESLLYAESNVYVRGRTFVFRYANKQQNYSNLGSAPGKILRATAWRGFGDVACVQNSRGLFTGMGVYSKLQKYYLDDNSPVVPAQIKNNTLGTEGYLAAVPAAACAITPFLNETISRAIVFKKNNCEVNQMGSSPVVTIPANTYGSTISQADANAKAETAWSALNNQDTANLLGVCSVPYVPGVRVSAYDFSDIFLAVFGMSAIDESIYIEDRKMGSVIKPNIDFVDNFVEIQHGEAHFPFIFPLENNYGGFVFEGFIQAPITGQLTLYFRVANDELFRLYVDNTVLLELNSSEPRVAGAASLNVTEGQNIPFKLFWLEKTGLNYASLRWSWNGQDEQVIPASAFFYV